MREDLLYFLWRHNKLQNEELLTTESEVLKIQSTGTLNKRSGPDFFNAKVYIGNQLWAGNVEMHVKSSDWYAHHHETDSNYNNVILHVVWEDDVSVFRSDGSKIPTVELKNYVSSELLEKYLRLVQHPKKTFINCEVQFRGIDFFLVDNWLQRLYIERLEQKSILITSLLKEFNNDWEAVLFLLFAKNFGSKVNGQFFLDRAKQLKFSTIRKTSSDILQLESLLFGHFGLLQKEDCNDAYYLQLNAEHQYLTKKFELSQVFGKPEFFGLRPSNFPTIRLSQLAKLYNRHQNLFDVLMKLGQPKDIYEVLRVTASFYWENHFTFGKLSKTSVKKLSKSFMDLLIINTIIPLKFCYSQYIGQDWNEDLLLLISQIKNEENSIIKGFENIGSKATNALESQSKIQLYTNYCSKNKCLQCALGSHLLNRNT